MEAPSSYRIESDWIEVLANNIQISGEPSGVCQRAGKPIIYKGQLVLPSGEPLASEPQDVRLMIQLTSTTGRTTPLYACDARSDLADPKDEVTCTLNTATAPNLKNRDNSDGVARSSVNRNNVWTKPGTIIATLHHDTTPGTEGYKSATSEKQIEVIPACPIWIDATSAPEQIVVHKGFSLGLVLFDQFENIAGKYSVRFRAFTADPFRTGADIAGTEITDDFTSSIKEDGVNQYNQVPTNNGIAVMSGLYVKAGFVEDLGDLPTDSTQRSLIWVVAHVVEGSARGCDAVDCNPFDLNSDSCSITKLVLGNGVTQADIDRQNHIRTNFGCLAKQWSPILVTPDKATSCRVIAYPSYDGIIAGPRFGFDLEVEIIDQYGLRVHTVPESTYAFVYTTKGSAGIRRLLLDVNYFGEEYVNVALTSILLTRSLQLTVSNDVGCQLDLDQNIFGMNFVFRLAQLPMSGLAVLKLFSGVDGTTPLLTISIVGIKTENGVEYVIRVRFGSNGVLVEAPLPYHPDEWDCWYIEYSKNPNNVDGTFVIYSAWSHGPLLRTTVTRQNFAPSTLSRYFIDAGVQLFSADIFTVDSNSRWQRIFNVLSTPLDPEKPNNVAGVLIDATCFDLVGRVRGTQRFDVPWAEQTFQPVDHPSYCYRDLVSTDPDIWSTVSAHEFSPKSFGSNGCVRDGLAKTVKWSELWYPVAPDVIEITARIYSYSDWDYNHLCSTTDIKVRPGPPHRLRCNEVQSQIFSRDPWFSSVDFVDLMGNTADCQASFPATSSRFPEFEVTCTGETVQVSVLGEEEGGGNEALLQPPSKRESRFSPRGLAGFHPIYAQEPKKPLLGADDFEVGAQLPAFGGNMDTSIVAGWDASPATSQAGSRYSGTWEVGSTPSAIGGNYFFASDQTETLLFMRYLTTGRIDIVNNIDNPTACKFRTGVKVCSYYQDPLSDNCCKLGKPGRVIPLRTYSLQFRYRIPDPANVHTGKVLVTFRRQTRTGEVTLVAGNIEVNIAGTPTGDTWVQNIKVGTAPDRANYASIQLSCDRSNDDSKTRCGVEFDEINLVLLEEQEEVTLLYETSMARQNGMEVWPVTCGPTIVITRSQPPAPRVASCNAATCNNNGYCETEIPWFCPPELDAAFDPYCCRRALAFCCGGLMRDTADLEFRTKCNNQFCSGNGGQYPIPPPCSTCYRSETLGFWDGDNCEKCADGYYGERCQFRICAISDKNGKECSGHGLCQSDGKCTCFGVQTQSQVTPVQVLRVSHDYLRYSDDTTAVDESSTDRIVRASCSTVLSDYTALGLPDEGAYALGDATADSDYYCRFFRSREGRYYSGAVVAGVWKLGTGTMASNVNSLRYQKDTASYFMPLTNLGRGQADASVMFSEDINTPALGRRWLHTTLQDGGGSGGGAFARPSPGAFSHIIFATNPADRSERSLWIMVEKDKLQAALNEVLQFADQLPHRAMVPVVNSYTRTPLRNVCVYISGKTCPRADCTPTMIGIFSSCSDELNARHTAWPMWFGEGKTGRTQRTLGKSMRIMVTASDTGVDYSAEREKWEAPIEVTIPRQYTHRVPQSFTTAIKGVATPEKTYFMSKWDGTPVTMSLQQSGAARISHQFERGAAFRGLPSTLSELEGISLRLFAKPLMIPDPANPGSEINSVIKVRVKVQTAEGRVSHTFPEPTMADPSGYLTLDGSGEQDIVISKIWDVVGRPTYTLTVSDLPGMNIIVEILSDTVGGMFNYNGASMRLAYQRVPPLDEFSMSILLKMSHRDQGVPMNIFTAEHEGGGIVTVDLNTGSDDKPLTASVRVRIIDSLGITLESISEGLFVLFTNKWVRLRVTANLEDGEAAIFLGKSKLEDGLPAFTLQNSIASGRGRPLIRALNRMSNRGTWGNAEAPFTGFMRDILVQTNAQSINIALSTGTLGTYGLAVSSGLDFTAQGVVPPAGTSFDGVTARIVPDTLGNWAGELCDVCKSGTPIVGGFHGSACNKENCNPDSTDPTQCTSATAGTCTSQSAVISGVTFTWAQCICQPFYTGEKCDRCEPPPVIATRTTGVLQCLDPQTACPTTCAQGGKFVVGEYFPADQSSFVVNCIDPATQKPRCLPPQTKVDECNCPMTPVPVCAAGTTPTGCCQVGVFTKPAPASYNCQGYANLYISCPETDGCGKDGASAPICLSGTEGKRQYSEFCVQNRAVGCTSDGVPVSNSNGWANWLRFQGDCPGICATPLYQEEGGSCGKCPEVPLVKAKILCGEVLRDHIPVQKFKEDFCGCSSPVIPTCEIESTFDTSGQPYLTCQASCPSWLDIYERELGSGFVDRTTGEILVHCGNWPAPEWVEMPCSFEGTDPCECELPKLRCITGTEGFCDQNGCPAWGPAPRIDCGNALPPKVNQVVDHVCGCDWPKEPVCREGTEPELSCPEDSTEAITPQLGYCGGRPQFETIPWSPGRPRFPLTRACLGCKLDGQPRRQCIEGTQCPLAFPCDANTDVGSGVVCPQVTYNYIDCQGVELPPIEKEDCWCLPAVITACQPSGGGCFSTSGQCSPYVCGIGRMVAPVPGDVCRTSCSQDSHCIEGHVCITNECKPEGTVAPPLGGCQADPSICQPYDCDIVSGGCRVQCWTDKHCLGGLKLRRNESGYRCSFPTLTGLTEIPAYQKLGSSEDVATRRTQPPNLCGSSGTATDTGAQTEPGRCVWSTRDPNACFSHNDCLDLGMYACGKNNTQIYFANAKCRTSCANDAHCHHTAHCQRSSGSCVKGSAAAPASCSTKDYDYCTPYACGKHITLSPLPTATCRTSCEEDGHCLYFYRCVDGKCVATDIITHSFQPIPKIPAACYKEGQEYYGTPYKCLAIPIPLRGNPVGRLGYALPATPPPAIVPTSGACTKASDCHPYRCGSERGVPDAVIKEGSTCQLSCEVFDDCAEGFACNRRRCMQLRAPAAPCSMDRQCASGNCVDGICCNTACDLPCQKCTDLGVCSWVDSGNDDRNDCGRCNTCVENADPALQRVCGPAEDGKDSKNDCGLTGICDGNSTCRCHANPETGYWEGEQCAYCAKGYSGKQCTRIDVPYSPPTPANPGSAPQDTQALVLESRAIQFPVRVLDFSTQTTPGSVNNLLGEPDATENYYVKDEYNKASAWEPRQVCFLSFKMMHSCDDNNKTNKH